MPYQIKKYDGTELTTIPDYQYNDTAATMVLFGKGVTNYGQPMAESLIHLLENFAGPTPPGLPARLGEPMVGQLWYDTANRKLRVRSPTTNWDVVGSTNVGTTPPNPPNAGDLWLDTSTDPSRLKVWNGTNWQLVGGAAAASSRTSSSSTGNAVTSTNNYFTTTALGANAEPQIGDLWYDPDVGRLKVYNGQYWQFVASAATGFVDTSITNNTKLTPTADSTMIGVAGSGTYHTSSSLGPSMGVFVSGDIQWDNVRNQLFIQTDGVSLLVGPKSPYRLTALGEIRNFTDHFHFTGGTMAAPNSDDMLGIMADGNLVGVWSSNNVISGDLPTAWDYTYGTETRTVNIRDYFNDDSRGTATGIVPGLNMTSNILMHSGSMCVGELKNDAQIVVSNEDDSQGSYSIRAIRYNNTADAAAALTFDRYRGDRAGKQQVQNGDVLGNIEFSGWHSNQLAIGSQIKGVVAGTSLNASNYIPSNLVFYTSGGERLRILDSAIRGNVNFEAIAGAGNSANQTSATEYPSYTFAGNTGTGMSSPNGGTTLNLALQGQLLLQLVSGGTNQLYGNWNTTGNHTVGGNLTVVGDITGDEGIFRNVTTSTITVNNETVDMSYFMRRDGGTQGAASRTPTTNANVDGSGGLDFGSSSQRWGIFYGVSSRSLYADLAERYESDKPLDVGTVVKIGGDKEITSTTSSYDTDVFGVISVRPAVAMNDGAGSDETHPFVALTGRIPCKVVGPVKKGQRIVSSEVEGCAMAMETLDSSKMFAVIGRALEDKDDSGIGLIEVVVGKN